MKFSNSLANSKNYFFNSTDIAINKGDINKLAKAMKMHCLEREDIHELMTIVKSEEPDFENKQLGERANDWILKVFGKVINCEGKINPDLTANSLAVFIKKYYGIAD